MPRPVHTMRITGGMSAATGALALLTLVVPNWIEVVFGTDPDGGDGALELIIVVLLGVGCLVSGTATGVLWRHQRRSIG